MALPACAPWRQWRARCMPWGRGRGLHWRGLAGARSGGARGGGEAGHPGPPPTACGASHRPPRALTGSARRTTRVRAGRAAGRTAEERTGWAVADVRRARSIMDMAGCAGVVRRQFEQDLLWRTLSPFSSSFVHWLHCHAGAARPLSTARPLGAWPGGCARGVAGGRGRRAGRGPAHAAQRRHTSTEEETRGFTSKQVPGMRHAAAPHNLAGCRILHAAACATITSE